MELNEFRDRLEKSTHKLIEVTQQQVTNTLSHNVEYLVEPNSREASDHLNQVELQQLKELNAAVEKSFTAEQISSLLTDSAGLAPLWINSEIHQSTRRTTTIKLICSRRLRGEKDMRSEVDEWPPFHLLVPLPPWYKEGVKFNINWKHQMLKRKWYALTWKWRYAGQIRKNTPPQQ